MEVGLHPWMIATEQFAHGADGHDFTVSECCDTVANRIQAGEIMGDHEDRQPKRRLQCLDEFIELARRDGIETGCRFVKKHDGGIERESPRFVIPPDSSEGNLSPSSGVKPTISSLAVAISFISESERTSFSRIGNSTFCSAVSDEKSAPC